jgi:xylose isomerase
VNIEVNHAILARHTFHHEVAYAIANGVFGSIDVNRGDSLLGWDTDQFPTDVLEVAPALYEIMRAGGFATGGLNFDAKLRRQSIDPEDLFHAHIGGIDTLARALLAVERMIEDKKLARMVEERYAGWSGDLGRRILDRKTSLAELSEHALSQSREPRSRSGRQELFENLLNRYL